MQPASPQSGSQNGAAQAGSEANGTPADPPAATETAAPTPAPTDIPSIIGGNIIGVGSKINRRSVIVYEKAKNYRLFEFVWDPSKDTIGIGGQSGTQVGAPSAPGQGIAAPFGQPQTNPFNTQPMPQANPNPAPPQP
jgi:hypothetical protein